MQLDAITVTVQVTKVLEKLGVSYFIGGSLASTLYGMVRTTQGSDVIANLRIEHLVPFTHALEGEFYLDDEMIANAIIRRSSFNIIHRESMSKVDVFIPQESNFIQMQFARARMENLSSGPETTAMVASPEDILLAKLEWYRLGGEVSERQWRDVQGVLKVQTGALDIDYLYEWASELKIADLLQRALKESE